ncbi:unnamed protein product [Microthlaspi erraticum]|uniref:Uncharacterized protein n=1 Tax=Microthlaspi erraticum TaxID=1685480 RepID=A0A6D2HJ84_9BRAS|nr:unnamed protein product [Microthlaspi erraticum]
MGRLVQLVHGAWEKAHNGDWRFVVVDEGRRLAMIVGENEKYYGLVGMVGSKPGTAIGLACQFPEWMLGLDGRRTLPVDIKEDGDVELFLAIQVEYPQVMLCVTISPCRPRSSSSSLSSLSNSEDSVILLTCTTSMSVGTASTITN